MKKRNKKKGKGAKSGDCFIEAGYRIGERANGMTDGGERFIGRFTAKGRRLPRQNRPGWFGQRDRHRLSALGIRTTVHGVRTRKVFIPFEIKKMSNDKDAINLIEDYLWNIVSSTSEVMDYKPSTGVFTVRNTEEGIEEGYKILNFIFDDFIQLERDSAGFMEELPHKIPDKTVDMDTITVDVPYRLIDNPDFLGFVKRYKYYSPEFEIGRDYIKGNAEDLEDVWLATKEYNRTMNEGKAMISKMMDELEHNII